jgi:staphylococcal nuclease domain-containing protein 1
MAAEEEAKKAGKNVSGTLSPGVTHRQIWKDYSEEDAQAAQVDTSAAALPPKYIDVYVSAVKEQDPFSFSVQTLEPSSESANTSSSDSRCRVA